MTRLPAQTDIERDHGADEPLPLRRLLASAPPRGRDTLGSSIVSVAAHALLIGFLVWLSARSAAFVGDEGVGTGIGAGIAGGGGGGGSQEDLTYFTLPPAPRSAPAAPEISIEPVLPTPVPELTPVIPTIALTPATALPSTPTVTTGGAGTGQGSGEGAGEGPGQGPGSGGGSGGGEGGGIGSGVGPGTGRGRILAPAPTVILMPPVATRSVRGKTVVVRLDVDSAGIVRDVELIPPTGDGGYDRALRKIALGWKFKPARDAENRPVEARFDVTFTF